MNIKKFVFAISGNFLVLMHKIKHTNEKNNKIVKPSQIVQKNILCEIYNPCAYFSFVIE